MALCLRLCVSSAEGAGSIPDRGTKISHAAGCGDKVKKKKKMKKKNNLTGKKLEDHKIHTIQNTFFCEK